MTALALVSTMEDYLPYVPEIEIVPTTAAHIRELQRTIRDADRKEIEAYGFTTNRGLWLSYKEGLGNCTAFVDGKVAACWGCAGVYMGAKGRPWLLTSYEVEKISPLKFAKIYQREVYKMLELFPLLENFVADDYEKAVRMLSIIGFTIGEPEKIVNGMYRKFTMKRAMKS